MSYSEECKVERKVTAGEDAIRMAEEIMHFAQALAESANTKLHPVMTPEVQMPCEARKEVQSRDLPVLFSELKNRMEQTMSHLREIDYIIGRVDL